MIRIKGPVLEVDDFKKKTVLHEESLTWDKKF